MATRSTLELSQRDSISVICQTKEDQYNRAHSISDCYWSAEWCFCMFCHCEGREFHHPSSAPGYLGQRANPRESPSLRCGGYALVRDIWHTIRFDHTRALGKF